MCKYISENTDNIIIFSGEGADEAAQGYIHFYRARSTAESDAESRQLLHDKYLVANLRADRIRSAHG